MPEPGHAAPARPRPATTRGAAKLDAGKLGDVLAGKGEAPLPPAGAEQRSAAAPPPAEAVAPPRHRGPKGISTSLEVPPYLMDNIARYLRANGGHNMRTLLFTGLTRLGIHVEPEDLVPQRQRRSR